MSADGPTEGEGERPERQRGRPRAADIDARILDAALSLLAERGYRGMSIPAVASAAGVTRPTVYLRYASKYELAVAAIATLPLLTEPTDTGRARDDLVAIVDAALQAMERIGVSIVGLALAEETEHPEFLERLRTQLTYPFQVLLRDVLQRGIERGQIRPDVDVDAVSHLLHGAPLGRYLTPGRWQGKWSEQVVAAIWPALEAPPG